MICWGSVMDNNIEKYFSDLSDGVKSEYKVAGEARNKGLDPADVVEMSLAMSMAEKSVGLVSTIYPQIGKEVSNRILELEEDYGQLHPAVSFKIAEEVAKERFCKFESLLQAIDAGIRVGFSYNTLGVVASPIEGFTKLELKDTRDDKKYFAVSFSGPIRSAGTTATCVVLMLIDYLREMFGFAKYDPNEDEVKRYITENYDYHELVTNLQYLPDKKEIEFLAKNMPIEITGDPTEKKEVSNYKDLLRVKTNFIRGGMCLVFSEGLAQKAQKGLGRLRMVKENGFVSTGWDFLEDYVKLHKKVVDGENKNVATYLKDLVAGRPIYGHPGRSGGFRFRYGRSRVSGFSSVSVHPATMEVSNNFLSNGVQLKIEKPTKGCIITCCDSIDGPIVKLKNGSVKKICKFNEIKNLYSDIEEIIYLGDILFPLGDVKDRNCNLLKSGYVEEWWKLEAEKKDKEYVKDFNEFDISFEDAVFISKKFDVSLHPKYIYYWTEINKDSFRWLLDWLQNASWNGKLILPYSKLVRDKFSEGKRALELLGVEHNVVFDNVVIVDGISFLSNIGLNKDSNFKLEVGKMVENCDGKDVLEIVNNFSEFEIRNKAGTFIGARMGRPEKAKLRKLQGSPNVLFPVSEQGGRFKSLNEAVNAGFIKSNFPLYKCREHGETIYRKCEVCGRETTLFFYCRDCDKEVERKCDGHFCDSYVWRKIDINYYFDKAVSSLGLGDGFVPGLVKGVYNLSSKDCVFENIAKGILRSKYNLCVNKDGTIRYDATEVSVTHFKPREARVSVNKLKELGYLYDIKGNILKKENQILELKPHDVILPSCPVTLNEKADDVFFNIAQFIDELLEKFYKLPKFYKLQSKDDLVGQLVVCMAPHNCAGVVGRIIGFSKTQGLMASPFMHAAMRRDCDGDEAAVMLLMDVLLNFSQKFLPSHRGGRQDAPLVLNAHIRAGEVDDQILNFETCWRYPLELYEKAEMGCHSSEVEIDSVGNRLKKKEGCFSNVGFTHNTLDFNDGVVNSAYKILPTMKEKVSAQMDLVGKIRAVDTGDVARLIIERHFIPDIRGNFRKFSRQQFRCVKCNKKYRRPPMVGVCLKCGGKLIFTISEGSIKKYIKLALELSDNFEIPAYTKQSLNLLKFYVESIFGKGEVDTKLDNFK